MNIALASLLRLNQRAGNSSPSSTPPLAAVSRAGMENVAEFH